MWIVLHALFIWHSEAKKGKQHPDRISATETGHFLLFVNGAESCYGPAFVNGRGPRADTDLVDRVTSAGIQGPADRGGQGL